MGNSIIKLGSVCQSEEHFSNIENMEHIDAVQDKIKIIVD